LGGALNESTLPNEIALSETEDCNKSRILSAHFQNNSFVTPVVTPDGFFDIKRRAKLAASLCAR
jgi:hypothetical protein